MMISELSLNKSGAHHVIDHYISISIMDLNGVITDVNSAFCKHSGYSKNELLGKRYSILFTTNHTHSLYKTIWNTLEDNTVWSGEIQNKNKNGSTYWVKAYIHPHFNDTGKKIGYITIKEDINDKKALEKLAIIDPLTELYNRHKFNEIITHEVHKFKRYKHNTSLIICDIDHFKHINDKHGHLLGDIALKTIAATIQKSIRKLDTAARWGGDEFIIILPDTTLENAIYVAQKIRKALEVIIHNEAIKLTASFGVAKLQKGDDELSWFKRADDALYLVKEEGKNAVMPQYSNLQ